MGINHESPSEPMSAERLAEIRVLAANADRTASWIVRDLLAEVERLQAEVKMLRDANYKRRHRSDGMQVIQALIPVRELLGCAGDEPATPSPDSDHAIRGQLDTPGSERAAASAFQDGEDDAAEFGEPTEILDQYIAEHDPSEWA